MKNLSSGLEKRIETFGDAIGHLRMYLAELLQCKKITTEVAAEVMKLLDSTEMPQNGE